MHAVASQEEEIALSAREQLLSRLSKLSDLPALGSSVTRAVQLASQVNEPLQALANFVLSDIALTQRVLRMANSVCYRTASAVPVTTVSKAILLMGFENVRTSALAMLLIDRLSNRNQAEQLRRELAQSMVASVIARRVMRETMVNAPEEGAVAALFRNLGRVLLIASDHPVLAAIESDAVRLEISESDAAVRHIGCTLDELSQHMLKEWNIPEEVSDAVGSLTEVPQKAASDVRQWIKLSAHFGAELAAALHSLTDPSDLAFSDRIPASVKRLMPAMGLTEARLQNLARTVQAESVALCKGLGLAPEALKRPALKLVPGAGTIKSEDAQAAAEQANAEFLLSELQLQAEIPAPPEPAGREASGKPTNARELLLAAVQDLVQSVVTGQGGLNDMMMMVLEALIRALGFRFATVFLLDRAANTYRARLGLGEFPEKGLPALHFPAVGPNSTASDVFSLALQRDLDLVISDAFEPKIRGRLPNWYVETLPTTRSFVLLPLVFQNRVLGLFYADRLLPAPEGLSPEESGLLRTLKNQVLARLQAGAR